MDEKHEFTIGNQAGGIIILLFFISWFSSETSFWSMAVIALCVGWTCSTTIDWFINRVKTKNRDNRAQMAHEMVDVEVNKHIETLVRKRRTLIRQGDYGEIIDDRWKRELVTFLEATISPEVYELLDTEPQDGIPALARYVDELVADKSIEFGGMDSDLDVSNYDGVEYEEFCATILERNGWRVQRTSASGDQGVDLIAEKSDRRVAIQCKRHNSSVGNKAVQEIYSGMGFYEIEEGVVVTNSTFTSAAKELAKKHFIDLLHHDQLATL